MNKPSAYPHSQSRYEADVERANGCLRRRSGRLYAVIVHEKTLSRINAFAIRGLGENDAMVQALALVSDLGPTYSVDEVQEIRP
jgi:hypothetical protein